MRYSEIVSYLCETSDNEYSHIEQYLKKQPRIPSRRFVSNKKLTKNRRKATKENHIRKAFSPPVVRK